MAHIVDLRAKNKNRENIRAAFEAGLESREAVDSRIIKGGGKDVIPIMVKWQGLLRDGKPNTRAIIITSLVIFAIAALVQVFQKNIITTVFFVLLAAVTLLQIQKRPRAGNFELNPTGLKLNDKSYDYKELRSFWVDYRPEIGIREISVQSKKWHETYIKIPIGEENPVQLRAYLLKFIPEIEHEDTLADILARKLGI